MGYVKDSLYNTSLPTMVIEEAKLRREYPELGYGDEGTIYSYDRQIALKKFNARHIETLPEKFKKIEQLGKLSDPNAVFPIGLFGFEDEKKEGYFCDLVLPHKEYKDFERLQYLKNMRKLLRYVKEADKAIQRFHKAGLILGDIKGDNIMIDRKGHVRFIDTDNWMYGDFGFDIFPGMAHLGKEFFDRDFSLIDNDRFAFAIMVIQYFVKGDIVMLHKTDRYFKRLIELMNASPEVKDGFRLIFSDADNKPYIGQVLKSINPYRTLVSEEAVNKTRYIY